MANNGSKGTTPFKPVKAGNKAKSTASAATNRPQTAIAYKGEASRPAIKLERNSQTPNARKLQKAGKSAATPSKGGSGFKGFLGQ